MLSSIAAKTVRESVRGLVWWSIGLVGLAALMLAFYPSIRDNPSLNELVENYPEALKGFVSFGGTFDYTTGAGYLGSELFSFMVPLLLLVAAIGAGARAIAGEEESGTLDLLLANPVSRRRVVVEKLGALVAELVVLGAALWVALWVGGQVVDLGVSAANLGAATVSASLLALLFGCVALLVGSASGHRGRAIGVASAIAVAAYFLNALAPLADALEPFQRFSPYYWYAAGDPLRSGLDLGRLGVLVAVTAVVAALAPLAFDRRDIAV
jgi:ABC-2 type transport system permease protein